MPFLVIDPNILPIDIINAKIEIDTNHPNINNLYDM
jgi:hypothetical protein